MKGLVKVILLTCLVVPGSLQAANSSELKTEKDKLSYSIGLDMGTYLHGIENELDYTHLLEGLQAGYNGEKPVLSMEEMQAVQQNFAARMKERQEAELAAMKEANKKAGDEFLATNKKKEGVVVTESGLQYEVVEAGNGESPKASDTVSVHYKGTTIDGKVFDDSNKRGEPAVFGVNQVIPGWTEVLQLMKKGAKYKVVIPSELAYGEQGVPPMIAPNAVLVFDIELLTIVDNKAEEKETKKEETTKE